MEYIFFELYREEVYTKTWTAANTVERVPEAFVSLKIDLASTLETKSRTCANLGRVYDGNLLFTYDKAKRAAQVRRYTLETISLVT